MSGCWTNRESRIFRQEDLQGHQSHNQKLKSKTYLNPQIVNYEFIKSTLSKGCLQGSNRIHVNPNFRGNKLNNVSKKNYPHLGSTIYLNSQKNSFSEPGTSNSQIEKSSVSSSKDQDLNCSSVIPYQSRFKKVNVISSKSSNKVSYSWSKNKTRDGDINLYSVNQSVKSLGDKSSHSYMNNKFKYTSPKIVDQSCNNSKSRLIFRSKTKIINESKTNISPRPKPLKERKLNTSLKRCSPSSKFVYDNCKKSSVIRVAKAVRSKYKYLNNSEQYKKSKYKIDKRIKLPENVKKKSGSKEVIDIRKLFPNFSYNKIKLSSYYVYNLNKDQTVSKSLIRKNQLKDKVTKSINQFQNRRVVKIGGILYKSTTTKLTLAGGKVGMSSKELKSKGRKNCIVYVRGEKFTLENNGKALKRQAISGASDRTPLLTPRRIDIGGVTYLRKSSNVLIRTNVHQARHFVNKAKNKSIALLANLRKRSSMPCMIYHRFGRCNRHSEGLCIYKHDPKNIAVCKKFLKGDCSDSKCLLSHQIIQEKMATCHFFLKGLCSKENCPFLHVKLSKNAAICENFLQGFCNLGKECSKRHLLQCPKFDKFGACNLGAKCPYPHKKLKTTETPNKKGSEDSHETLFESKDEGEILQYYLHPEIQKKSKKRKQSVSKLKENNQNSKTKKSLSDNTIQQNCDVIECFPKRVKLDKLPVFIPLNSGS